MRIIERETFIQTIQEMFIHSASHLSKSVINAILDGARKETNDLAKSVLSQLVENAEIAEQENIPLCQDTGIAVVYLEIGNEVYLDFDVTNAVNEAVHNAYTLGYLRKSVVRHPLDRVNTLDNTPAVIHISQVLGNQIDIKIAPKGAGSENMSRLAMLTPGSGREGIIQFVLETIRLAGGKACPPMIIGVGIGGNFEKVAEIAKESLFRYIDDESTNEIDAALEKELYTLINDLDVGPMGLGGVTTCLAVKVNSAPCHIASLPVAVNIQCHSARKSHKVL